jgi:uncharacterized membrane protein YraQ (UPF0718 family)
MNEKIKSFVLTVVISLLIGSSVTFLYMEGRCSERIEQYRTTESTATADNQRLREELQRYTSFNTTAREIVNSQKSSIDKLREIIKNLPD